MKILRKFSKFIIVLAVTATLLLGGFIWGYNQGHSNAIKELLGPPALDPIFTKPNVFEVWQEVNKARKEHGLAVLALDERLNRSAEVKCQDMALRNYWEHNTPEGIAPWTFVQQQGVKYNKAGENLAYGHPDSKSVVVGWLISPSHKANMLDPVFTHEGLAVCESPNYQNQGRQAIVVQHLIN